MRSKTIILQNEDMKFANQAFCGIFLGVLVPSLSLLFLLPTLVSGRIPNQNFSALPLVQKYVLGKAWCFEAFVSEWVPLINKC